ncbi:MAG: hypothetical protein GF398_00330 [Chitinivibrionales bacterium]|nr:hypothetical protein [Chitinivibrionales bacterium]
MKLFTKGYIVFYAIVLATIHTIRADLPVFPGAEGYGTTTPAGRGGKIIKVTNLRESGPGSLKDACSKSGRRIVVFEVGGVITLSSSITIRNPYITIAGQTAPSPGITITGRRGINIRTHDVLIQHLAVRMSDKREPWISSDATEERVSMSIYDRYRGCQNIVVDHCTFQWHNGKVSLWTGGDDLHHDYTFSNCIIAEGLQWSIHHEGAHSKGMLIGDYTTNVSVIRSLFMHNWDRNPACKGRTRTLLVNNVVYNPGANAIVGTMGTYYGGTRSIRIAAVGNVLKSGANTSLLWRAFISASGGGNSKFYYADNVVDKAWDVHNTDLQYIVSFPQEAMWTDPLTVLHSSEVNACLSANVGPRPADRDTIDARLIREWQSGAGRIINSPDDVGGLPIRDSSSRAFDIPANPHGDDDGDGYTNIEEMLHQMAADLEAPSACIPKTPEIAPTSGRFAGTQTVTITTQRTNATIHYTLDGSDPTPASAVYTEPLTISTDATIKAITTENNADPSETASAMYTRVATRDALVPAGIEPGLKYDYYAGRYSVLPDFASLTKTKEGTVANFEYHAIKEDVDSFAVRYWGYLKVAREGLYTFSLSSDDGSRLWIGDTLVIDNDGFHSADKETGQIGLKAGYHPIYLFYFERSGDDSLSVMYEGPGIANVYIPDSVLYHVAGTVPPLKAEAHQRLAPLVPRIRAGSGRITISLLRDPNTEVTVLSAAGRTIARRRWIHAPTLHLNRIPNGVYLVRVVSGETFVSHMVHMTE